MIGKLLEVLIGGAIAITASAITKELTGKHIHEHVFQWWCELRDFVSDWLVEHAALSVRKVCYFWIEKLDDAMIGMKKTGDMLTIGVAALDAHRELHEVTTKQISIEEALQVFPQLRDSVVLVQEVAQ